VYVHVDGKPFLGDADSFAGAFGAPCGDGAPDYLLAFGRCSAPLTAPDFVSTIAKFVL